MYGTELMTSKSTEPGMGDVLVLTGGHRVDFDALFSMMSARSLN